MLGRIRRLESQPMLTILAVRGASMDELDDDEEFDRKVVNILNGCMPLILSGLAELRAQGVDPSGCVGETGSQTRCTFNPVDT